MGREKVSIDDYIQSDPDDDYPVWLWTTRGGRKFCTTRMPELSLRKKELSLKWGNLMKTILEKAILWRCCSTMMRDLASETLD